jgi:prepilin-type N-terminal cleavage/methylation domain-containing protein
MRLLTHSFRRLAGCASRGGFTLIELLTVMAIIAILAGLILSISGYATKKGAMARASAEIQALSAGCESYKADNGTYPHQMLAVSGSVPAITGTYPSTTGVPPSDILYPAGASANGNSTPPTAPAYGTPSTSAYANASLELYEALTGDLTCTGTGGGPGVPNYISSMKPDVWGRTTPTAIVSSSNMVYYLSDPFGNSYGYSTVCATAIASGTTSTSGYNPTFDLWCTGGSISTPYNGSGASASGQPGDPMLQWVRNW